jgi:PKD repeat protein
VWDPNEYTTSPYLDSYHYTTCASSGSSLTGVLYNESDNSVAASGMYSNVGCDGWMVLQYGNFSTNFQNNTPYYFIITDANTGQTWQTPCFEDTGNDSLLVACTLPLSITFSGATINEGATYSAVGSFTDPNPSATTWTAVVNYEDGSGLQPLKLSGKNFSLNHTYEVPGTYKATISITDNNGATDTNTATVLVNNVPPIVGTINISPSSVEINSAITASAPFTDPGMKDTHVAVWNWGDGKSTSGKVTEINGSGTVTNTHTYTQAGIYTVTLSVTDNDGGVGISQYQNVIVYNPSGGIFEGAGSFTSPVGSYPAEPNLKGTVNFSFSVAYINDKLYAITAVSYPTAKFSFALTSDQWLVVTKPEATTLGTGYVGEVGGYTILLSGISGRLPGGGGISKIRIRITDRNNKVIYDSQPGTPINQTPSTPITGIINII